MRLEVLVDSEDPAIYPLNRPEIIIGAGEANDIILVSSGISRKHVKIIVDNDSYFVVDQGSTNGTFINEERLVPGRKTEFTSFFPVRLGDHVLLTLLSDDDAQDSLSTGLASSERANAAGSNETTKVISLKDFHDSSTKKLVKKRQEKISTQKKAPQDIEKQRKKKKENASTIKTVFGSAIVLAAAIYYNYFYLPRNEVSQFIQDNITKVPATSPAVIVPPVPEATAVEVNDLQIPLADLISLPKLTNLFGDLKCLIPEELYFCDLIPSLKTGNGGVASMGLSLIFLIKQSPWFIEGQNAKAEFLGKGGVKKNIDEIEVDDEVVKLAFLYFLKEQMAPIDLEKFGDKNFYFVFYLEGDQDLKISRVFAVKGSKLRELIDLFNQELIDSYMAHGLASLVPVNQYFQAY